MILGASYHVLSFPQAGSASLSLSLKVTHSNSFTRNRVALTGFRSRKAPLVSLPGMPVRLTCSEEAACPFLCPGGLRAQDCSDGLVKHRLEASLRQSRALEVFHGVCREESRCCTGGEGSWGRQWGYPGFCSLC